MTLLDYLCNVFFMVLDFKVNNLKIGCRDDNHFLFSSTHK